MTSADPAPDTSVSWKYDIWRLGLILFFAISVRAVMIANTAVVSRDCVKFVRDALALESPPPPLSSRLDVVRNAEYPPGYPAAILAMSHLVRPLMGGTTVDSMAMSAQLVSALSGVLLVIPFYALTRRIFDRNTACAAGLLFTVLPVCVEVTSDGISDGLFMLTAAAALWLAVRALDAERPRSAFGSGLGAGVFCGLGYLVRPDAAIVALAAGLTFAGVMLTRLCRRSGWRAPLLAGVGLVVGSVLVAGPYVKVIGRMTNKPTGKGMMEVMSGGEPDPTYFQQSRLRNENVPLAAWWDPVAFKGQSKPIWALESVIYEYLKTGHYTVPIFALIGLFATRRRLRDPRIVLLLTVLAVQFGVLWIMAWKIGYVSQRHTLLLILISCVFAATSFPALGTWAILAWRTRTVARFGLRWFAPLVGGFWARRIVRNLRIVTAWCLGAIWTGILVSTAVPRDFYSLHSERAGHKAAGQWLAANADPYAEIIDPFGWAEWYAGRSVRVWHVPDLYWPTWNPFRSPSVYVIFEPNSKSPHSRLEHYERAKRMSKTGTIQFQYPADANASEIRVAVYLCPALK